MKTSIKIFILVIMLMTGLGIPAEKLSANNVYVNFQVFYDQLSPYGDWVFDANYGYVWIPDAGPGFIPYASNGYWEFTDYGWTWVSEYPWGWAPFHYGRWYFDPRYGPVWIPGNEWGPAWVVWRRANGCYGWTPMGPNVTVRFAFSTNYYIPPERWVFVSDRDFCRRNVHNYYFNRSRNADFIANSTVIMNTHRDDQRHGTYVAGPRRDEVQEVSGRSIQVLKIRDSERPGTKINKGALAMYRPVIEKNSGRDRRVSPEKVVTYNDLKRKQPSVRSTTSALDRNRQKDVQRPDRSIEKRQKTREKSISPQERRAPDRKYTRGNSKSDRQNELSAKTKPRSANMERKVKEVKRK